MSRIREDSILRRLSTCWGTYNSLVFAVANPWPLSYTIVAGALFTPATPVLSVLWQRLSATVAEKCGVL